MQKSKLFFTCTALTLAASSNSMADNAPVTPPTITPVVAAAPLAILRVQALFERMDSNHDGFVSRAEHADFSSRVFAETDTNHDGKLSLDEVIAAKTAEDQVIVEPKTVEIPAPDVHLQNRVNANPADHSINKGGQDDPTVKYLSK